MQEKEFADCAGCNYADYMAAEEQGLDDMVFCEKCNDFIKEKYDCKDATYERLKQVATEFIEEKRKREF